MLEQRITRWNTAKNSAHLLVRKKMIGDLGTKRVEKGLGVRVVDTECDAGLVGCDVLDHVIRGELDLCSFQAFLSVKTSRRYSIRS